MAPRYTGMSVSPVVRARIAARQDELSAEKSRAVTLTEALEVILDESDRYRQVTGRTTTRENP